MIKLFTIILLGLLTACRHNYRVTSEPILDITNDFSLVCIGGHEFYKYNFINGSFVPHFNTGTRSTKVKECDR